jgi:hypothetical protein
MAIEETSNTVYRKRIVVIKNGPYAVEGNVPLESVAEFGLRDVLGRCLGRFPVSARRDELAN